MSESDSKQFVENLTALAEDPIGQLMLKENISIPSLKGVELLAEELEHTRTPNGETAMLDRLAIRFGLDKLVRSHSIIMNMLLRLAIQLDVKLTRTNFSVDTKEFITQKLEINPDGQYSDSEMTDIAAHCLSEIDRIKMLDTSHRSQIKNLKVEAQEKEKQSSDEIRNLKKELEKYKKYWSPTQFFFYLQDKEANKTYYLTLDSDGDLTPTTKYGDAEFFASEDDAINFFCKALESERSFKNTEVKVWDFKVGEAKVAVIESDDRDSSILKVRHAADSAKAFEEFSSSMVKDLGKAAETLRELREEGLIDADTLTDEDLGLDIEVPEVKPVRVRKPAVEKKADAGKTAGRTKKMELASKLKGLKKRRG